MYCKRLDISMFKSVSRFNKIIFLSISFWDGSESVRNIFLSYCLMAKNDDEGESRLKALKYFIPSKSYCSKEIKNIEQYDNFNTNVKCKNLKKETCDLAPTHFLISPNSL